MLCCSAKFEFMVQRKMPTCNQPKAARTSRKTAVSCSDKDRFLSCFLRNCREAGAAAAAMGGLLLKSGTFRRARWYMQIATPNVEPTRPVARGMKAQSCKLSFCFAQPRSEVPGGHFSNSY